MEFPTINGESDPYFDRRECRVCGSKGLHEPNSFAYVSAGTMTKLDSRASAPALDQDSFFEVGWHGAHSDLDGTGERPDTGGHLDIVKDGPGSQFAIYFCSTRCMRQFFNDCVDALEARIKNPFEGDR